MVLSEFITDNTGQAVCIDGTENNPPETNNTGQCEQLVGLYSQEVNGVTLPIVAGAVNLWDNPEVQVHYQQIVATQMQPGDIVVFGASSVINSPIYGHADIYVQPIPGGYQGFDSNWEPLNLNAKGYPTAHLTNHTLTDVLGGLRFTEVIVDNVTIVGAPASVGSPDTRLDVFARGSDNNLYQKYFDNQGWHPWVKVGSGIASDPSVPSPYNVSEGRIDVFFTGASGDLVHTWTVQGIWQANESLGLPEGEL